MNTRTRIAQLALAATIAAPLVAFADQPVQVVGDATVIHDAQVTKTRAEVKQELQAFRANPVAADGYRWVGGELGWASPTQSYAYVSDRANMSAPLGRNSRANEYRNGK